MQRWIVFCQFVATNQVANAPPKTFNVLEYIDMERENSPLETPADKYFFLFEVNSIDFVALWYSVSTWILSLIHRQEVF